MTATQQRELALKIATKAHAGQKDKSGYDYIDHPVAVAKLVEARGGDDTAVTVALLHDVIEDTEVTIDDLHRSGIDEQTVAAVEAMTHLKGESYNDYLRRVAKNPTALIVKRADLTCNTDKKRMSLLPEKTRLRLVKKYSNAKKFLDQITN